MCLILFRKTWLNWFYIRVWDETRYFWDATEPEKCVVMPIGEKYQNFCEFLAYRSLGFLWNFGLSSDYATRCIVIRFMRNKCVWFVSIRNFEFVVVAKWGKMRTKGGKEIKSALTNSQEIQRIMRYLGKIRN